MLKQSKSHPFISIEENYKSYGQQPVMPNLFYSLRYVSTNVLQKKMSISYACSWYEPANPEITTITVEITTNYYM